MNKRFVSLLMLVLTACAWPLAAGCHHKTVEYQRSDRIEQSEPQMVSPGHEKLE